MNKQILINVNSILHPKLFDMDENQLNQVCQYIFNTGYSISNPSIIYDNSVNKLETILTNLIGINENSNKKGKICENYIVEYLHNTFPNISIDITRNIPNSGDMILHLEEDVIIEIKNYVTNIDQNEIIKLLHDMKVRQIKYAIIISMKSDFVGKKQFELEKIGDNTILYLPKLSETIFNLEVSIKYEALAVFLPI